MKKFKVLVCMLSLVSLAMLTACDDDDDDNGNGGNPPGTNSITGQTMTVSVTQSDSPPFVAAGESYTITFDDASNYTFTDSAGSAAGTYTYDRSGNTATLVTDGVVTSTLTFTSDTTGTIESSDPDGNTESGTFTISGP